MCLDIHRLKADDSVVETGCVFACVEVVTELCIGKHIEGRLLTHTPIQCHLSGLKLCRGCHGYGTLSDVTNFTDFSSTNNF